jgi:hypothetical protein
VRVPLAFYVASLDVYRQLAGSERWSLGAGVELGVEGAGYLIVTRHFGATYASLTARAMTQLINRGVDPLTVLVPQLAFGHIARSDWSMFLMYARPVGSGINTGSLGGNYEIPQWLELGGSVRF